ncbi:MAG: adenylate/guanylate cyclase domain-containing protein [Alphaproteobacteria bacterium]
MHEQFEFAVHGALATIILGVGTGFAIIPLFAIGVAAPVRFAALPVRAAACAVATLITVGTGAYVIRVGPTNPLWAEFTRWLLFTNGVWVSIGVGIVMWFFMREMGRAEDALEREYARSESLLHNIMPVEVAERLNKGEGVIADDHAQVTVLFADIVGFTERSSTMPPDRLVALLNRVFTRFDALVERHGVEKIKTIGDAYRAVAGMPRERPDHAAAIARLAIDMNAACAELSGGVDGPIQIRAGIHSGPVVAGIIGASKFAYDLWGDVVNTASRMESTGLPGRVQVSEATRALLDDTFALSPRGSVEIKGKGAMETWFLDGARDGTAPKG